MDGYANGGGAPKDLSAVERLYARLRRAEGEIDRLLSCFQGIVNVFAYQPLNRWDLSRSIAEKALEKSQTEYPDRLPPDEEAG
jgi:hypothetical protein